MGQEQGQESTGENREDDSTIVQEPGQESVGEEKRNDGESKIDVESEQAQSEDLSRATNSTEHRKNNSIGHIIWVSNLAQSTNANDLKSALLPHGKVIKAKTLRNTKYPGSKCYGHVIMASAEDANRVIENVNNTELNGQMIKLEEYDKMKAVKQTEPSSNDKENGDDEKKGEDPAEMNGSVHEEEKSDLKTESNPRRNSSKGEISSDDTFRRKITTKERFYGERAESANFYGRKRENILTFAQIKEERERQKMRDKERSLREEARRRKEEDTRQNGVRRQEDHRFKREYGKLQMERDNISRRLDRPRIGGKEFLEENKRDDQYNERRFRGPRFDSSRDRDHLKPQFSGPQKDYKSCGEKGRDYERGRGRNYAEERGRDRDNGGERYGSHAYDKGRGRSHGYDKGRGDYQGEKRRDYQRERGCDYQRKEGSDYQKERSYDYDGYRSSAGLSGLTSQMGSGNLSSQNPDPRNMDASSWGQNRVESSNWSIQQNLP